MDKFLKRCEDCAYLQKKNGVYICQECFGQKITEIDDCPEADFEEVEELNRKAEAVKIDHGAKADKPTSSRKGKPHTVAVVEEKKQLFSVIYDCLVENFGENVQITRENKLISVQINGMTFKIDVIKTKKG